MINHIKAVLWKQQKDTIKNKTILIQFLMFPFMTIVMENAISIQDMPEHFFTNLFSIMYVGMAPLTSAAAIISEEKEKNTLRVLQLCNVRAFEYLIANAIYIVSICMIGSFVIGAAGGYAGMNLIKFMLIMLVGHSCSFLLGATIGVASKNQMVATSINVPVMMVLSFLPMLSMFNNTIRSFSKYIFSEQLYLLVNNLENIKISAETGVIMLCNILLILILFLSVYKDAFRTK
ncbi:MAG: ABC transporter permease [Clostridiales bacterium]|nr:ABC transporter permease [Clostridiales bacterium]